MRSLLSEAAEALERQAFRRGLKELASFFDGSNGHEVAKSTISRWQSEPTRFPLWASLELARMDEEFARALLNFLMWQAGLKRLLHSLDKPTRRAVRKHVEAQMVFDLGIEDDEEGAA